MSESNEVKSMAESYKILPQKNISLFVKDILIFNESSESAKTSLPFYADGYPGLLFHNTPKGQWVQPVNKKMPNTYLYGQTIHPIELQMQGTYTVIVFQLFPFVLKSLFNVNPQDLTDTCYDLNILDEWKDLEKKLLNEPNPQTQVNIISDFLYNAYCFKQTNFDHVIKESIQLILKTKAQTTVKELCNQVHLTIRTFERRFKKEIGIPAKDFIQIIKFQQSYRQLKSKNYHKLIDIVHEHGYADQSHFIRVFKAFTGKAPSKLMKD